MVPLEMAVKAGHVAQIQEIAFSGIAIMGFLGEDKALSFYAEQEDSDDMHLNITVFEADDVLMKFSIVNYRMKNMKDLNDEQITIAMLFKYPIIQSFDMIDSYRQKNKDVLPKADIGYHLERQALADMTTYFNVSQPIFQ